MVESPENNSGFEQLEKMLEQYHRKTRTESNRIPRQILQMFSAQDPTSNAIKQRIGETVKRWGSDWRSMFVNDLVHALAASESSGESNEDQENKKAMWEKRVKKDLGFEE